MHIIVAERQRQMLAAQLRHLERRSDALTQAGGDSGAALAQSIEQAMLQLTGAEVMSLSVCRTPHCCLPRVADRSDPYSHKTSWIFYCGRSVVCKVENAQPHSCRAQMSARTHTYFRVHTLGTEHMP